LYSKTLLGGKTFALGKIAFAENTNDKANSASSRCVYSHSLACQPLYSIKAIIRQRVTLLIRREYEFLWKPWTLPRFFPKSALHTILQIITSKPNSRNRFQDGMSVV